MNLSALIALAKVGIGGKESGESWEDPLGMQVGIETKILEINESSSVITGVNYSLQGGGYDESV
jgi:hypothetical protein